MEVIVEERNNPENFEKFFDVFGILKSEYINDNGNALSGFTIRHYVNGDINGDIEDKVFPEWKYRVMMV